MLRTVKLKIIKWLKLHHLGLPAQYKKFIIPNFDTHRQSFSNLKNATILCSLTEQDSTQTEYTLKGFTSTGDVDRPILILFLPYDQSCEHRLSELSTFDEHFYVMCFNYPGVGNVAQNTKSEGNSFTIQNVLEAAQSVVEHAKTIANGQRIIIRGHSFGGGVAAQIGSKNGEVQLWLDRTFSTYANAAGSMLVRPAPIAYAFLFAAFIPIFFVAPTLMVAFEHSIVVAAFAAWWTHVHQYAMATFLSPIMNIIVNNITLWEMNTISIWDTIKGRTHVTYAERDLAMKSAGLEKAILKDQDRTYLFTRRKPCIHHLDDRLKTRNGETMLVLAKRLFKDQVK